MIEFQIDITGTSPLLMHSSRLANPLDPAAKALKAASSRRTKTDEDHETLARLEHAGGLYLDPDVGPFIPGENIMRTLVDGAKLTRNGMKVTRGVFISTDINPLAYDGPRTVDGLWEDKRFVHTASVKVQTARVMRTRPIFYTWATSAEGTLDESVLDFADLKAVAEQAGALCGLGDWRPRFGRFTVELTKLREIK